MKLFILQQGSSENLTETVDRKIYVENQKDSMILAIFSLHQFSILLFFEETKKQRNYVNISKYSSTPLNSSESIKTKEISFRNQ